MKSQETLLREAEIEKANEIHGILDAVLDRIKYEHNIRGLIFLYECPIEKDFKAIKKNIEDDKSVFILESLKAQIINKNIINDY